MKCLSLFSGAGGLDLGLEAAGIEVIRSIEQDADCCATLLVNGRLGVINRSIEEVDFKKELAQHKVALVVGGPPCQPFSKSALWTHAGSRGLSDPRAETIFHFVRALKELRPQAFILENVEGFRRLGGESTLLALLAHLAPENLHYTVSTAVLDSSSYGVPQKRRRYFAVGILGNKKFAFPQATHGSGLKPFTTAWDACARVEDVDSDEEALAVKGRWAALLPTIPVGKNYLWHTDKGAGEPLFGWRTRYWSFLLKLDPHLPSPTIVANPSQNSGPFHWQNRLLSTRELSALQTFPSDYKFSGGRASRHRQIGNAVPPLLAEHIGKALMRQLAKPENRRMQYAVRPAKAKPLISPLAPVPRCYELLKGEHQAHPGTGRGPKPRAVTPRAEASP